jgi:hypothetical protein
MSKRIVWTTGAASILVGATVLISSVAASQWRGKTRALVDRLRQNAETELPSDTVRFSELDSIASLPAPVRRYFRTVLKDGQPIVRMARLEQSGTFALPGSANWKPFLAEEVFVTQPRGFIWDARIRTAPCVSIYVRDGYQFGRGSMTAALLGLVKVVDERDREELDAGALQRYLAEAVWFPTALLPGQGIDWTAIDDSHARAMLHDRGTTVSLEFEFAPTGEVIGMYTPRRYRENKGGYVATPWGVICRRYEERSGMRIPLEADVYWKPGDRIQPYWRGKLAQADYEFH